jgi:hypothetical protein
MFKEKIVSPHIATAGIIVMLALWFAALSFGQSGFVQDATARSGIQEPETSQVMEPAFSDYRGISIGTTEAELLERINIKPVFESEDDFVYVFSDTESAQFLLDSDRRVTVMSIKYGHANAPSYEDVFGKNVPLRTTPDGNVYNLVSYPDAGFWVAYYRSYGTQLVTLMVQKL